MEDFDTNIDIYDILGVNDEIEFEMFNFIIEGVEKPILTEELQESIWKAHLNAEKIPKVLREYKFNIFDDNQIVSKLKCKATTLKQAEKQLKHYLIEFKDRKYNKSVFQEDRANIEEHIIINENGNKMLEEVYIFNIENKQKCPICYSKYYFDYGIDNSRCLRCGCVFLKKNFQILDSNVPLLCPFCKNTLKYYKRKEFPYCNTCKLNFNLNDIKSQFHKVNLICDVQAIEDVYELLTKEEIINIKQVPRSFLCFLIDKFNQMNPGLFTYQSTSEKFYDNFYMAFNLPLREQEKRGGRYLNIFTGNYISKDTIYIIRQSRGYGCIKNMQNRLNCTNLDCEQKNKRNSCNLKENNIWISDYENMPGSKKGWSLVNDYTERVLNVILKNEKVPITPLLKILYKEKINENRKFVLSKKLWRVLITKFKNDFNLNKNQIVILFDSINNIEKRDGKSLEIKFPQKYLSPKYKNNKNLNRIEENLIISKNQKDEKSQMTITILNELIQKYKDEAESFYSEYKLESAEEFIKILELLDYIMDFARKNKKELLDIDYNKRRKDTKRKPLVPTIFEKEIKRRFKIDNQQTKRLEL